MFPQETTAKVIAGNTIVISNIFGGNDPPLGPINFELVIEGITNPPSSQPAGFLEIRTYFETFQIDQGRIEETFTPQSGNIKGTEIIVINPETSGSDSSYILVFMPESNIEIGGFIIITVPLVMIENKVSSGGICVEQGFQCTNIDVVTGTITIKVDQIIVQDTEVRITITGI